MSAGSRLDHVAHASQRVRDLLPLYRDVLGGKYYAGGDNRRVGYRAIVLKLPDGGKIELMQPWGDAGFFDSFFARSPAGGLHHVTYYVDRIEPVIERAEALGLTVVGKWFEPLYKEAFVHPRSGYGALTQFVEMSADYELPGLDADIDAVLDAP